MQRGESANTGLLSKLGLYTAVAIVVGAMVGSGIFKKPATMAEGLGSPEALLTVWAIAGILTLFGALTNAEVAGMISKTGGQYEYFRVMYGDLIAYLYGWAMFAVVQSGSIASITYVFSEYTAGFLGLHSLEYFTFPPELVDNFKAYLPGIGYIFPLKAIGVKAITVFVVWGLTIVNYFGVKFGGGVSATFTTLKILAIAGLIVFGFAIGGGSVEHFFRDSPEITKNIAAGGGMIMAVVAALSGAFWAYDGWNNITYITGEIKNPQRNLPKALFLGAIIVIVTYILINLAYLYILPVEEMAGSELVAASAAMKAFGPVGAGLVSVAVMISTFGTSNGTIMASARLYFAMSREKAFFRSFGKVHPGFRTPYVSLFWQAAWTSLLILSGTFDDLTDMLIFVSWIFYAMGAYGVIILRRKMPNEPRPYKVIGYPYVPLIFTIFAFAFVALTLYNDIYNYYYGKAQIINSLFGLSLVLLGVPLYLYFVIKNRRN